MTEIATFCVCPRYIRYVDIGLWPQITQTYTLSWGYCSFNPLLATGHSYFCRRERSDLRSFVALSPSVGLNGARGLCDCSATGSPWLNLNRPIARQMGFVNRKRCLVIKSQVFLHLRILAIIRLNIGLFLGHRERSQEVRKQLCRLKYRRATAMKRTWR